ncbi:MAG TPA: MOSC domain-containing protein [Pyrinomonadaceae bacterium]|nr:MOSC domain-containing protein [Pyrinomonadaceae bacterium]
MKLLGVVKTLWRYPVKSMIGEPCRSLLIDERGVVGDRLFAVRDEQGKFGSGKNTRRFVKIDGLFKFRAVYDDTIPVITFPDGKSLRGDDSSIHTELSEALNRSVTLTKEEAIPHFDNAPVHLVTTASLDWLKAQLPGSVVDERRFRPNVLIETAGAGRVEQAWLGKTLRIGSVLLEITRPTERCVMTTFAQPAIPEDKSIFACIGREAELNFGVYAKVSLGGEIQSGAQVEII